MPYDELGNFISDSEALDTMRYELAKKGNMPLRPDGSDVPYVMSEVPQRYVEKQKTPPASSATNFAQAVADKLGISALPQALLAMGTAFPAEVAKGMGYGDASKAMRYEPTSRAAQDILSGIDEIPRAVTGSHMGFGPLPETWVSGMGRVSPSDVRVMGANVRRIGNEIVELPMDFSNAQSGFKRQNVFGEPTLGVRAESAASDIGDVLARRQAAGKSSIPGVPESLVPETNMYAVRPVNAGQLLKETDMPTIRYVEANPNIHTVGYRLEEDILPYTGSDYPNTVRAEYWRHILERDSDLNRAYDDWASKKYMEMFPDAPNLDTARRAYSNQGNLANRSEDQLRMMSEFANSPEANTLLDQKATERDLAVKEYNEVKNTPKSELKTDEAKELHRAKVDELELDLLKKNYAPELSSEEFRKRISIPSADEYLRRANAARNFMLGEFRNDIAKYFGTSQGPQMELAKRGVTIPPKQELMERAKQISQGGADYRELMKKRSEAGFNPEGEMQPLVVQKEAELAEQQKQLDELNTKQNSLREQHRLQMPEEPDPARNPTEIGAQYRALRNPMTAIIEKMTKNKKQLENFRLANAYELVNDMGFIQKPASEWRKTIPYEQRHFFPDLFAKRENGEYKIPDNAPINHVASAATKKLGIDFLAEQYTQAILDGRVPIDEKGKPTVPVDKFIEQMTKPRLKEEELQNVEASRAQVRLNDYAQRTLASTDPALRFKNASVVELTKDNPMDVIRRQVSFDGMVLDNCVAGTDAPHPGINPFTNDRYSYSYPVDPATGRNRGERARNSSYMESIHQGDQRYASLRDNTTGIPVVNINMHRTAESGSAAPKYNIQYVSGYQNDKIDKKYTDDVRDYLNARTDIIQGSGKGLDKWGIYDLTSPGGQLAASRALGVPETALGSFDLPRFVTEKDLRELAKQQPIGDTHADLVAARDRLSQEMRQLINEYGAGAPEAQDVANQLQDLDARLNAISTQVRNAPSNDLALQRDDAGMRRLIAEEQPNIDRAWEDVLQTLYDYEDMTPAEIRAQANLMRRDPSAVLREYDEQFFMHPGFIEGVARQLEEQANQTEMLLRDEVEAQPAAPRYTPRDIALSVHGVPAENIEGLTSQIQTVVTNLDIAAQAGNRLRLEELRASFSNPNNLPESIIDYTHDYPDLERVANYLIEHIDYRLANQEPNAFQAPTGLTENQIEDIASNYIYSLGEQTPQVIRQEASDMRNGMIDLPELFPLNEAHRRNAQNAVASRMEQSADAMVQQLPTPQGGFPREPVAGNGPEAYRDYYTNEITGSREAFDNIMQAERLNPGAINEAIHRTDGRAMYSAEVQQAYHLDSPAGVQQLNNALRRYMDGNGFDIEPVNAIDELERRYPEAEVRPEDALAGAVQGTEQFHGEEMVREIESLVDRIQADDILFDREPEQFIARLRDEANEYAEHNLNYSSAIDSVVNYLESYLRERTQRTQRFKRGGIIRKETGGRVEPTSPSPSVNDQSKPATPPKRIINPDAPEFKDLFIRERANRTGSSGGGSGPSPADIKQMMNPRNINYNAGGNVSIDEMRYELLRK